MLESKLKEMQNKVFMHKTNNHRILNFRINCEKVTIVTDKTWIDLDIDTAEKALQDEFLPVEAELADKSVLDGAVMSFNGNGNNVFGMIQENIEKIQKDKNYIPQATAINDSVNTMVNVAKLEIQMRKIARGK